MTRNDDLLNSKLDEVLRRVTSLEESVGDFNKRVGSVEVEQATLKERQSSAQTFQLVFASVMSGLAALSQFFIKR